MRTIQRKSPILHKVKKHKRKNRSVRSYTRGKGNKPTRYIHSRRVISKGAGMAIRDVESRYPEGFTVTFYYASKKYPVETVYVVARDLDYPADDPIDEALSKALQQRKHKHLKAEQVVITDPSLGEILGRIGRGIKTGIKRAVPHVKAGLAKTQKGLAKAQEIIAKRRDRPEAAAPDVSPIEVRREYQQAINEHDWNAKSGEIRHLIFSAYETNHGNPIDFIVAKGQLRNFYPSVYRVAEKHYGPRHRTAEGYIRKNTS